jgi:hypothetical protein
MQARAFGIARARGQLPYRGNRKQHLGLQVRRDAKLGRKQTRCRSIPAGAPTAAQRGRQGRVPRQVGMTAPRGTSAACGAVCGSCGEIAGCKAKPFCYMPKCAASGTENVRTTFAMRKLTGRNAGVGIAARVAATASRASSEWATTRARSKNRSCAQVVTRTR